MAVGREIAIVKEQAYQKRERDRQKCHFIAMVHLIV